MKATKAKKLTNKICSGDIDTNIILEEIKDTIRKGKYHLHVKRELSHNTLKNLCDLGYQIDVSTSVKKFQDRFGMYDEKEIEEIGYEVKYTYDIFWD